jgi:hypothetical protein
VGQNNGTAVEAAHAQGQADRLDGKPMNMKFWHEPDEIKDAYARGYNQGGPPQQRARPPKGHRSPKPAQPTAPHKPVRVWKNP